MSSKDALFSKGILHTLWHHAHYIKQGRGRQGRMLEWCCLHSWVTAVWWSPEFLWMAEHLPAHGSGQRVPCFTWLACLAVIWLVSLSLSQPVGALTFILPSLSPITTWREWASSWEMLGCWRRSNHKISLKKKKKNQTMERVQFHESI